MLGNSEDEDERDDQQAQARRQRQPQRQPQPGNETEQTSSERNSVRLVHNGPPTYGVPFTLYNEGARYQGWSLSSVISDIVKKFWKDVEDIQDVPRSVVRSESLRVVTQTGTEKFKHKFNKFDKWFHNLNKNMAITDDEKSTFQEGFNEVFEALFEEMTKCDVLFKYLVRKIYPAGSSWENLKICSPDEYDVNIILAPVDIYRQCVEVEDLGCGHIGIRLTQGFSVLRDSVSRKLSCYGEELDSNYQSITSKLEKWLDGYGYVIRSKVLEWMQGVVDKALYNLTKRNWNDISSLSRSTSGPAITVNVVMNDRKTFSMDLVAAFEFTPKYLPSKMKQKTTNVPGGATNWFAIPKGSRKVPSSREWRASLYQMERNLMKGNNRLKPSIRIMKRLRDEQKWTRLSSYYIKTMSMLKLREDKTVWSRESLGSIVMFMMSSLRDHLEECCIDYYWDENLNLLDDVAHETYCTNVANYLRNIQKQFDKSLVDNSVDPMHYFGCDKYGNPVTAKPCVS